MTALHPIVQTATLRLPVGADEAAPGAAITVALCGQWDHGGPCRWPHHTSRRRTGDADPDRLELRVVTLASAPEVDAVRATVVAALAAGALDGPNGTVSWELRATAPGDLIDAELELAERLARG